MNPTILAWTLVLAAGINSCIGNLLLKKSRLDSVEENSLFDLLFNPWFLSGLFFYGINVILFAKALEHLPVSLAYPVLAGSGFLFLIVTSAYFFNESLSFINYLGLFLILIGISLMSYTAK